MRRPQGGTRSLSFKRGTLIRHPRYGLCTIGGYDRKKQTISLHDYRTGKRLTQGAKGKDGHILTWVAWHSWLVKQERKKAGKGVHSTQAPNKERLVPPLVQTQGPPQAV